MLSEKIKNNLRNLQAENNPKFKKRPGWPKNLVSYKKKRVGRFVTSMRDNVFCKVIGQARECVPGGGTRFKSKLGQDLTNRRDRYFYSLQFYHFSPPLALSLRPIQPFDVSTKLLKDDVIMMNLH